MLRTLVVLDSADDPARIQPLVDLARCLGSPSVLAFDERVAATVSHAADAGITTVFRVDQPIGGRRLLARVEAAYAVADSMTTEDLLGAVVLTESPGSRELADQLAARLGGVVLANVVGVVAGEEPGTVVVLQSVPDGPGIRRTSGPACLPVLIAARRAAGAGRSDIVPAVQVPSHAVVVPFDVDFSILARTASVPPANGFRRSRPPGRRRRYPLRSGAGQPAPRTTEITFRCAAADHQPTSTRETARTLERCS